MAVQRKEELVTAEEYLESERASEVKHEYHAGRTYAMAGASPEHARIASHINGELYLQLKGSACSSAQSDLRVRVEAADLYTYPDVAVSCQGARYTDDRPAALLNPVVLSEVLSPSTHDFDRGTMFELYQMLDSLTDYIVFRQDRPYAEHYTRQPDGSWLLRVASGIDAVVEIKSLGCRLELKDVYAGIELPPTALYFVREPVADPYVGPRADWAKALERAHAGH